MSRRKNEKSLGEPIDPNNHRKYHCFLWSTFLDAAHASSIDVASTTPHFVFNSQLHNILVVTAFVTGILRGHGHGKACQDIMEEEGGSQTN
jgi:hypothetical protein